MRAVAYTRCLPAEEYDALVDIEIDRPSAVGLDLLVEVRAVSVNPVDVKRRAKDDPSGKARILGYDGAGVVVEAGVCSGRATKSITPDLSLAAERMFSSIWSTSGSSAASRAISHSPRRRRCL